MTANYIINESFREKCARNVPTTKKYKERNKKENTTSTKNKAAMCDKSQLK